MGFVSSDDVRDGEKRLISAPLSDGTAFTLTKSTELISASELPSAAAALAELFPDEDVIEEIAARSRGLELTSPSDGAEDEKPEREIARAEDLEEESQSSSGEPPFESIATKTESARSDALPPEETTGSITPEAFANADETGEILAAQISTGILELPADSDPIEIETAASQAEFPAEPLPLAASDWAFEERLASHKEWVESRGTTGNRFELAHAQLEAAELIGVNLRFASLQDAQLKGADMLMADLRDASLIRANLQETCLVGTNFEGANLEGAHLDTAMGLVPRQLAGANLHGASLPDSIQAFEALPQFQRASQSAHRYFWLTIVVCLLSALVVALTKDVQLVTNSCVLPFIHSASASAALPTVQFYLIAPVGIFVLFLVFEFRLQNLWDALLELPSVFPDGRVLGENSPRAIAGMMRAHFRWISPEPSSTGEMEKGVSIFLAHWIVPFTMLLFWARYLTLQHIHGTALQEILLVATVGVAFHSTTRLGRPRETWMLKRNRAQRMLDKLRAKSPAAIALAVSIVMTLLAVGTFAGVPAEKSRAPQYAAASIRRWAPGLFKLAGFDPYPSLPEAMVSTPPPNWDGSSDQLPYVKGARLNQSNFRYTQAYGIFLVNAHLWRADFQGAFLPQADLRGADIGQGNLSYATLDQARLNHANLDRANLAGANLARADLREANLSYTLMGNATLVDARLEGATLYGAQLSSAVLIRANLEKTDLRESQLNNANLEHADMQQAYLWSANLAGARLVNTQLANAIFIDADLRGADLRWAKFPGTVLDGADLSGSLLDGADLSGASGLSANQVCSAHSRQGALFSEALQTLVTAQCGTTR